MTYTCAIQGAPTLKPKTRRRFDDYRTYQHYPDYHSLCARVFTPALLYCWHAGTACHLAAPVRPAFPACCRASRLRLWLVHFLYHSGHHRHVGDALGRLERHELCHRYGAWRDESLSGLTYTARRADWRSTHLSGWHGVVAIADYPGAWPARWGALLGRHSEHSSPACQHHSAGYDVRRVL